MTRHTKKPFAFFLWHRRLGLLAMVLIIILSITGIMLNHSESLRMDSHHIDNGWLLDWYGLNPKGEPVGFNTETHTISQWDDHLFFNDRLILRSRETLQGAIEGNGMIIILLSDSILLLDMQGAIIEHIKPDFGPLLNLGMHHERAAVKTADKRIYLADKEVISWEQTDLKEIAWIEPVEPGQQLRHKMRHAYRGKGLTLERIILDLHSGRLFNARWGVYVMDASAVVLILLSISGFWTWWTRRLKMRSKRHYQKHHRI